MKEESVVKYVINVREKVKAAEPSYSLQKQRSFAGELDREERGI